MMIKQEMCRTDRMKTQNPQIEVWNILSGIELPLRVRCRIIYKE